MYLCKADVYLQIQSHIVNLAHSIIQNDDSTDNDVAVIVVSVLIPAVILSM